MPHRAFITGITGFVGSHLAEHLLACGDRVFGTGVKAEWEDPLVPQSLRDVSLLEWDLRRDPSDALRETLAEQAPTVIYHLAAVSIPALCGETEPTELATQVNVDGTRRVLELAESLPDRPRVLVVSSSYVYGRANAPLPNPLPSGEREHLAPLPSGERGRLRVDETARAAPHRGYGITKLAAEELTREAAAAGRLDCVIARPFNHTGPRQTPELMLPEWCRQFAAGTDPVTVHTLDAWLDLTDVRDIVRGYRLLAEHGRCGAVYNLGSGIMRRSGDLFRRLHELAGGDRPYVESQPGEKHQPIADCTRLLEATGWRPRISLWQTIGETFGYWRERIVRCNESEA